MLRALPILSVFLLCLFAGAAPAQEPPADIQALMIGNSYTSQAAASVEGFVLADPTATGYLGVAARGGWTAEDHYLNRDLPVYDGSTRSLVDKLHARDWDVVIVQEQSTRPSMAWIGVPGSRSAFRSGMIDLADFIRQELPTAEILYFQTWPRDWGHAYLDQYFQASPRRMQLATNAAYARAAMVNAAEVLPVGSAWTYSMYYRRNLQLHANDGSHAGPAGRYLTGAVFYAFLFNRSPLGSAYAGGLPDIDRAWLLKIANGAWRTFGH